MSWRIRDKQSARKATLAAQAAVVVLAASGVATATLGPRLLEAEPPPEHGSLPEPSDPGLRPPEEQVVAIDSATVAEYMSYLGNTPQPDPVAPEVAEGPEEPDATTTSDADVRYIGSVRVGARAAAWVNIGGVTKLLRPGGEPFQGVELISVGDDEIVISVDGGDEATVEKAERQGPAVTVLVGGAPAPVEPVVAGESPEPRFSPDMSREERRAMLLERAREERSRSWQRDREERGEEDPGRNQR